MVIGPQRRVTCFHAPSTITFGELRRNVQELLPFFSMVEFDVYTEAAVQSVVEQKNVLAGLELQEVGFWAHARRQISWDCEGLQASGTGISASSL